MDYGLSVDGNMIEHLHERPLHPSRVVVIGASGFIGSEVIRQLTQEEIPTVGLASSDVDLCDPKAPDVLRQTVHRDDVVVITSALTPDKGKDVGTFMKNVTMGSHLSQFFHQVPCAHVIYVSSDAVYADTANPVREDSPCDPGSLHGLMHVVRERLLIHAVTASKTPLLVLRPVSLYGPKDPHNSYGPNRFIRTALTEGKITLIGQGEEQRDHVYAPDLSRLLVQAILWRSVGVLNVATGHSVSFGRLAQMIVTVCEGKIRIESLPRQAPATHRFFQISTCLKAFPTFQYTPIQTGLAEMAEATTAGRDSATARRA